MIIILAHPAEDQSRAPKAIFLLMSWVRNSGKHSACPEVRSSKLLMFCSVMSCPSSSPVSIPAAAAPYWVYHRPGCSCDALGQFQSTPWLHCSEKKLHPCLSSLQTFHLLPRAALKYVSRSCMARLIPELLHERSQLG